MINLILSLSLLSLPTPKEDLKSVANSVKDEFRQYFPEVSITDREFVSWSEPIKGERIKAGIKYYVKAFCRHNRHLNDGFEVRINKEWWMSEKNYWFKRKVIAHELGHCILDMRHPKNLQENSIMGITENVHSEEEYDNLMKDLRKKWRNTNDRK